MEMDQMKEKDRPVIVSLDWDWVTGDTSDGYNCCGMCGPFARFPSRQRGLQKNMSMNWRDNLEKLKELPVPVGTPIFVAECHGNIVEVFKKYVAPIVVDYDAHVDKYNYNPIVDCANWIVHLEEYGGTYKYQYEWEWYRIDAIFLCRSSPWTPLKMDEYFHELLWFLCHYSETDPKFIGHMRKSMRKAYYKRNPKEDRKEL